MLSSLQDPDWWFTTLLGLIVISLIWSYARSAVLALAGTFVPAVRHWREARIQHERRHVDLLASNPDLLLMELVRCVFLVLLFLALVGFYLFFSILGTALLRLPEIRQPEMYDLRLIAEVSLVLGAALGLCSIYFGTPITPRLHTVMRARAEYENRCKRRALKPSPTGVSRSQSTPCP